MAILRIPPIPQIFTFATFIDLLLWYSAFRALKWLFYPFVFRSPFYDIPGPPSQSWFMGNLGQLFNAKGLPFHQDLVDRFGGMVKVHGFFGDEQLYISDPRALQSIIFKEQDAFEETPVFTENNKVIFGPGLVATTGDQHTRQRKIVNPIFSISNLKNLMPVFYEISEKLADVIRKEVEERTQLTGDSVLDMSEWMCRVALETVGQTILGYSFDPLDSPHNNPYTSAIKDLIPTLFSLSLVRQFAPFLVKLGPPAFRRKLVEWTPHQAVQKVKHMSDVMHETAQEILRQKRDAISCEGSTSSVQGRDIISILLRTNAKASDGEKLSEAELTGQMTVLIFGAQDTTSSALSRILHLLATRPDIQDQLREEIQTALRGGNEDNELHGRLGYDEVTALPLLDAVLKETLRLYPPVPFVRRTALKERTIPYSLSSQSSDEVHVSSVTIPAGTTIFVSIAGSNRLESIWGPDANEWKPERWLSGNVKMHSGGDSKDSRIRLPGIYSGMMSFLGGGRACIGYKFAQVEMKVLLSTLISRFTFSATKDEIVWNLSQIISPSVKAVDANGVVEERKGLPLIVREVKLGYE